MNHSGIETTNINLVNKHIYLAKNKNLSVTEFFSIWLASILDDWGISICYMVVKQYNN